MSDLEEDLERAEHLEPFGTPLAVFEDLQPMDAEGAISVWKGSRAKGFDKLNEVVAVSWKALEKGGRNAPANACLGLAASTPSSRRNAWIHFHPAS